MYIHSIFIILHIIQSCYLNYVHPVPSSWKLPFVICKIRSFYFQHTSQGESFFKINTQNSKDTKPLISSLQSHEEKNKS